MASPEAWIALATLTALEIVLGIDNIIFISILVARLPEHQRGRARPDTHRRGLFLLWKSTHEIHNSIEGEEEPSGTRAVAASFGSVIAQIAIVDIVFSLDSVITAVGLADQVEVMVVAIVMAVLVAAKPIGDFVDRHRTIKLFAPSFLIL